MLRRVRRAPAALVALGAVLALAGCGGGSDERDAVRAYILKANTIQDAGTADLDAANAAYRRLSRGKQPGPVAVARLRDTVDHLRATRARLAQLSAPPAAGGLRGRLLAVFDRNIDLAQEAAELGAYVPASTKLMGRLPRLGQALRRGFTSGGASGQERALAAYARRLTVLEDAMRALQPPEVLLADHRGQLVRLDNARSLTERLRAAVSRADSQAVATLLLRFRDVFVASRVDRSVQRAAVRGYRERLGAINTAVGALQREQQRVQRTLK